MRIQEKAKLKSPTVNFFIPVVLPGLDQGPLARFANPLPLRHASAEPGGQKYLVT